MTIFLAAALLGQNKDFEPLIYPGSPVIKPVQAAKSQLADIETDFHTVTGVVSDKTVKYTMVTLYKNRSPFATDATLTLPVVMKGDNASFDGAWTVLWGDQPVNSVGMIAGMSGGARIREYTYKVSIPANGSKSLKTEVTVPIQKLGEGGMERKIAYRVVPMPGLHRLSIALKYDANNVFRVIKKNPGEWPWQVSNTGAYVQINTPEMRFTEDMVFQWYRGGFDKVGDGGR